MSPPPSSGRPAAGTAAEASFEDAPWWGDEHDREALRVIAEGVRDLAGFDVVAISVVSDGLLLTVAVAGDDDASAALAGLRVPLSEVVAEMELADSWGLLRFLPHDRSTHRLDGYSWIPTMVARDEADAWHPHDTLCALLTDQHGEVRGALSMDVPRNGLRPDVGQRRILEAFARQAEQAIIAAIERRDVALDLEHEQTTSRYRQQLIDVLTHELQNPVAAISGNVELLLDEDLPPMAMRSVTAIDRSTRRIRTMISDLLGLAEVDDPDRVRDAEPVDLAEVTRDVIEMLLAEATQRDVSIVLEAGPEPLLVLGTPSELDTMVVNLVANAVKYSDVGGEVRVQVRPAIGGTGAVVVQVEDDGIGIAAEDQGQLFDEFFRADNTATRSRPGTGLGLAIVNRVVKRHRGHIDVQSQPGRGSTFRVVLPGPSAAR